MSNILTIGKSALAAAQVGIDVTGHNIANASTAGYVRETVVQGAVAGQDMGFGFVLAKEPRFSMFVAFTMTFLPARYDPRKHRTA